MHLRKKSAISSKRYIRQDKDYYHNIKLADITEDRGYIKSISIVLTIISDLAEKYK